MVAITMGTNDFRAALGSVLVHAGADPELPMINRVRVDIDADNAWFTATDRFTVGLALASVLVFDEPEINSFDISPADAKQILALFKGGKEKADEPELLIQLSTTDTHLVVTDVSGLIPGRVLKLPILPVDDAFPSVPTIVSGLHQAPLSSGDPVVVAGHLMDRFCTAAKVYREPLTLEKHSCHSGLLMRCGESFLGVLMPLKLDEEMAARNLEWVQAWARRLLRPPSSTQASPSTPTARPGGAS